MTLLYLAIIYLIGIEAGRQLWLAGIIDCNTPTWLWWISLACLPFTPLLNFISERHLSKLLRWPTSAGFAIPRQGQSSAFWVALSLCVLMGIFRFASNPLEPCLTPDDLAYYNLPADSAYDRGAPQVTLVAYVSSYPLVEDNKQTMVVTVESLFDTQGNRFDIAGKARLNTDIRVFYRYGQNVSIHGRLVTPPVFEDFNYREYLARKDIHSLIYSPKIQIVHAPPEDNAIRRALYTFRESGEKVINRLLPEPYASLANGMLLGIEAGIPDELYDKFNLTGTSHTIVISGSNVSLIAAVIMYIAQRAVGRRRALIPTLLGIAVYAMIVGGDAAVLRAALMGGLYVTAISLGRRNTAIVSLATACAVMTLINPLTLWDVGFQLSSAATAGLILFSPGVTNAFAAIVPGFQGGMLAGQYSTNTLVGGIRKWFVGLIEDGLLITIAANISTLPLILYYFDRFRVVSILAPLISNLLIAPVQPFIMLWGSLGIVIGVIGLEWVAQVILWIPWLSLVWTVFMVEWTAQLPMAEWVILFPDPANSNFRYSLIALTLTYGLIGLLHWRQPIMKTLRNWSHIMFRWRFHQWIKHIFVPVTIGVLAVMCLIIWLRVWTQPDGRLHVHFLDIGQGDGIFIQTPSGRQILIDGGISPQQLFAELGEVMPYWDRDIDMLLLSHPDGDHMDAQIHVPARYQVTQALHAPVALDKPDANEWVDKLTANGVQIAPFSAGGWIDLGDGVALWFFWPPEAGFATDDFDNENSLVAKLVYGNFSVLLTGDAGLSSEDVWLTQELPLASTILKVGHHGSNSSTGDDFLASVNPSVAVIQVGENTYGHPTREILELLDGLYVLRNDLHGRVHVATDGHLMWIDVESNTKTAAIATE
ncbi:MAG: ComEC/Rec2 family competence protein [Chloroflexota bacterium]